MSEISSCQLHVQTLDEVKSAIDSLGAFVRNQMDANGPLYSRLTRLEKSIGVMERDISAAHLRTDRVEKDLEVEITKRERADEKQREFQNKLAIKVAGVVSVLNVLFFLLFGHMP